MKNIIILLLLVLVSCSKSDPKPGIVGHWVGSSSSYSVDMTVLNTIDNGGGNNITGTYSIKGTSYPISSGVIVYSPNNGAWLATGTGSFQMILTAASDYSKLTVTYISGGTPFVTSGGISMILTRSGN